VSIIQVSAYGCSVRLVNNGFNFMFIQGFLRDMKEVTEPPFNS